MRVAIIHIMSTKAIASMGRGGRVGLMFECNVQTYDSKTGLANCGEMSSFVKDVSVIDLSNNRKFKKICSTIKEQILDSVAPCEEAILYNKEGSLLN